MGEAPEQTILVQSPEDVAAVELSPSTDLWRG